MTGAGGNCLCFEHICMTDAFRMYESSDLISHYTPNNCEWRKATHIHVIVGNSPCSSGLNKVNDSVEVNNPNATIVLDGKAFVFMPC